MCAVQHAIDIVKGFFFASPVPCASVRLTYVLLMVLWEHPLGISCGSNSTLQTDTHTQQTLSQTSLAANSGQACCGAHGVAVFEHRPSHRAL